MKPDRIKISHEFPGLWLSVEIPIAPDENVIDEFKKGKSLLVEAYRELAEPNLVPISEALGITQVEKGNNGSLIDHVRSCTELATLETYRLLVKGNPGLQDVYDKKLLELSK